MKPRPLGIQNNKTPNIFLVEKFRNVIFILCSLGQGKKLCVGIKMIKLLRHVRARLSDRMMFIKKNYYYQKSLIVMWCQYLS